MVYKPDDSTRLENKFKLSLLQVEKRFVDLETTISEMNEKLKEMDIATVADLKERIDDLEDLIIVEQAGIIELKKMLEESRKEPIATPEIEERIKELQTNISDLVNKSELQTQLEGIKKELVSISSQTERVSRELYEKVEELTAKAIEVKPTIDFDLLESLRTSVDDISKKKIEWDLKLAEIEKKFDILENRIRESLSEKILGELKLNKQDIITANVRIDSIERVSRDLIKNMQNIESSMKKFESLERFSLLGKEIEEKIERFKFIEDETRRLSSRIEAIYANIDDRLAKVGELNRKIPQISEAIPKLTQDIDKVRVDLIGRASKEDVNKRLSEFEKKALPETRIAEVRKISENLINRMEEARKSMDKKIRELETVAKAPTQDLEKRIDILNSKINDVQKALEMRIEEIKPFVEKKITMMSMPSPLDTEQVNDLFNKLVFLETRLAAIEKTMLEVPRNVPIVIE